jgi:hypothetical protein
MATEAGLNPTWPRMVISLLPLALAIRDADGDTLACEEVLDQIALPLKGGGRPGARSRGSAAATSGPCPASPPSARLRGLPYLGAQRDAGHRVVEDEPFLLEGDDKGAQDMVQVARSAPVAAGEFLANVRRGDLAQVQADLSPGTQDG